MKKSSIIVAILIQSTLIWGQNTLYDFLPSGSFAVGFSDTVIYDPSFRYEAFDYNGPKPYFIQLWHPLAITKAKDSVLLMKDYFYGRRTTQLAAVQEQCNANNKEIIIRDYLSENLETGEPLQYGPYSWDDVLGWMGQIKTRSCLQPLPKKSDFPIIVYHHGSQGNSFENFGMAEYFASMGFIFISSNFHLPYENTIYGLKPFDKLIQNEEEESLRRMVHFALSLSNSPYIFFVGHSWGAQMGFRTFDNDSIISGFVSMETTLEFKDDTVKIKEMWPEVFQKIYIEKAHYPFPILLFAATGKLEPYPFFNNTNAPRLLFAPTKEQFEHDAYTSLFFARLFLRDTIKPMDEEILLDRLELYAKHLQFMNDLFLEIMFKKKRVGKEIIMME